MSTKAISDSGSFAFCAAELKVHTRASKRISKFLNVSFCASLAYNREGNLLKVSLIIDIGSHLWMARATMSAPSSCLSWWLVAFLHKLIDRPYNWDFKIILCKFLGILLLLLSGRELWNSFHRVERAKLALLVTLRVSPWGILNVPWELGARRHLWVYN